jgi:hypothetical protein
VRHARKQAYQSVPPVGKTVLHGGNYGDTDHDTWRDLHLVRDNPATSPLNVGTRCAQIAHREMQPDPARCVLGIEGEPEPHAAMRSEDQPGDANTTAAPSEST